MEELISSASNEKVTII